jgi:hypothetical protein
MNQGSAHVERETEDPQYEQDYSDSPKHVFSQYSWSRDLIKVRRPLKASRRVVYTGQR